MGDSDPDQPESSLVPAGSAALRTVETRLTVAHGKRDSTALSIAADLGLAALQAFGGPIGSIIGSIAGKIEKERLIAGNCYANGCSEVARSIPSRPAGLT